MKKCIPYEKALEILEKIDDSYFSEAVTSDYKLLDEVWQMLWLAERLFKTHLDICGPQGEKGPVGTDALAGQMGICGVHPDPAGALGESGEPEEPIGFVYARFLPLGEMSREEEL